RPPIGAPSAHGRDRSGIGSCLSLPLPAGSPPASINQHISKMPARPRPSERRRARWTPVCRRMRNSPEILEVTDAQLDDVLRRVEEALDEKDAALIRRLFESYAYVTDLVEDRRTSIRRLRELLFGKPTEKTAGVLGRETATTDKPDAPGSDGAAAEARSVPDEPAPGEAKEAGTDTAPPPSGHGRNGAAAYTGATRVDVPHATLKPGDSCPSCEQGTLYER